MGLRKICLTENELEEVCLNFHNLRSERKSKGEYGLKEYDFLDMVTKIYSIKTKPSIFSRFAKFIDRHSDNFFMMTFVGMIFLLGKIAIESYFLSIK